MKIIKETSTKEQIYLASYFFAFLYSFLPVTMIYDALIPSKIGGILLLISILLMLAKVVLFDSFTVNEFVLYSMIFIIVVINGIKVDQFPILLMIIIFIGSRNINPKLIIQFSFTLLCIGLLFTLFLSSFNIIPNLKYNRFVGDTDFRYSLGTIYPTVFASFIFFGTLQYMFLKTTINIRDLFFVLGLTIVTHYLTDSRLVTTLMFLIILINLMLNSNSIKPLFNNQRVKKGWLFVYFLPVLVMLFLALTYNDSLIYSKMDNLLSGRINLSSRGFTEHGVTIFGQVLPTVGYGRVEMGQVEDYFYLDSLPVALLLKNGILVFTVYILYNFKAITTAMKKKDTLLAIILTLIVLYDVVDDKGINLAFNPFPFVVSSYFYADLTQSNSVIINRENLWNFFQKKE